MSKIQIEESYPPLNEKQIQKVEGQLRVKFPDSYRKFLLQYNGGKPSPDGFLIGNDPNDADAVDWFLGIHNEKGDNLLEYVDIYKGRIPEELVPIAHDSFGNLILIGVQGFYTCKIYFWDHEQEAEENGHSYWDNVKPIADSFDEFLNSLTEFELQVE